MPRGRPKKDKKDKKDKKEKKRGPGRPPGKKKTDDKKVKRGPGRPPGKKKATEDKKVKRRGRPPGKKTDKKKSSEKSSGKKMSKMQIAAYMAELHDMKKSEARDFINNFVALAVKEVKKNGSFSIPGMGKFTKRRMKARDGRNPATGEKIRIKAKTTVKARVSKSFKDEVL